MKSARRSEKENQEAWEGPRLSCATARGSISIPATDLHSRIGYSGHPIGPMSVAHGIFQPTSSDSAMVVGAYLNDCESGSARHRGFVLDFSSTSLAYRLMPSSTIGRSMTFDISTDPDPDGSLMAAGFQLGSAPPPQNPCSSTFDTVLCNHEGAFAVQWIPP